ncbi:MAG TPA: exosortase/archaeosortase family protein [Pyrinomonadaceae bacterium]|nr:exosortase/archaeosortase family protein [Pyrinomonadaceae bacterium]
MSVPAAKKLWQGLAIGFAIAFAYATVLAKLVHDWWTDENYSHGLLIPFIIGYILWAHRDKLARVQARPSGLIGGAAIVFSLFALWAGVAGAELYTQRLSLVLLLAGLTVYFWGWSLLRLLLVPLSLLFLALPIPAIIFNKIAFPLQLFASRCAVWSMSLLGIPVLREGNIIELKPLNSFDTKKLEVVEACSGIRSLMTLVTLAVVFAYFSHTPSNNSPTSGKRFGWLKDYWFWRALILIVSAVPIAILTNAFRVSGTGVLAHHYGTAVADGFFHSFSGWAIYIVAFILLFGIGMILDRFKPAPADGEKSGHHSIEGKLPEPDTAVAISPVISAEGSEL